MNILGAIKTGLTVIGGKAGLVCKKFGPTGMTVLGISLGVTTVVVACVATTKAEPILDATKERVDKAKENEDPKAQKHEIAVAYCKTAGDFAKLYAPAVATGAASIAFILGGHCMLKKQNAALMAMTSALATSYATYRQRVVDEFGKEKDFEYYNGLKKTTDIIVDPETGETTTKNVYVEEKPSLNIYHEIFDENNGNWTWSTSLNLMFLRSIQDEMNYILKARGYVFYNEVRRRLGFKETEAGQFTGWVYGGEGDNLIDFGIREEVRHDGIAPKYLLDFNVDGDILYILKDHKKTPKEEADDRIEENRQVHDWRNEQ